jgi:hypothetical protein
MEEQSTAGLMMAWLPFLIYIGTWIWGVAIFKGYKRSRERLAAESNAGLRDLVETNRQIAAMLQDLKSELHDRKA